MKINSIYSIFIFFILIGIQKNYSQDNEELKITTEKVSKKRNKKIRPYEPLAPAKAAFYSAILPGLGQAYTKKYWKIPIVYGAIGTGVYFYLNNNKYYNRYRDAYKQRKAGEIDEFYGSIDEKGVKKGEISLEQLIYLQRRYRREKELSILITIGLYVINIIDANVTAHLQQYNVSENLSFKPKLNINEFTASPSYELSLNYSF